MSRMIEGQSILILEDEVPLRAALCEFLEKKGMKPLAAANCKEARHLWTSMRPDIAILDYELPDGNALDLLPWMKAQDASTPIIILTAYGSIQLAVETIKQGADQFLTKPTELGTLLLVIERSLENHRNRKQQQVHESTSHRRSPDPFLGRSTSIRTLAECAHRVVSANRPVLITGETGTGKGVLAHWLHRNSTRSKYPMVDLNCGGLSADLLESELFGHGRGAFTGATQNKVGLLELAHKGTVFLDEIGDMTLPVQAKVLKVVEEKTFRKLGEVREHLVDIRLIAATHRDLAAGVKEKTFRDDLYFRISTISLVVPALRDRVEDIPMLAENILQEISANMGRPPAEISSEAMRSLQSYSWPGNIREMRNILERAVLMGTHKALTSNDWHFETQLAAPETASPRSESLEQVEIAYIQEVLRQVGGRVNEAAIRLDIPRSTLYYKLKLHKIGHFNRTYSPENQDRDCVAIMSEPTRRLPGGFFPT
jgi:DNA-binding NtrC family response regulator